MVRGRALSRHGVVLRNDGLHYYIRVNDQVLDANPAAVPKLFQDRGELPPFLDRPCEKAKITDIDVDAFKATIKPWKLPRPPEDYLKPGIRVELHAGPLVVEHCDQPTPTHLGIILFGRDPSRFIPGCHATFSVYRGDTRATDQMGKYPIVATIPNMIRQLLERLSLYQGMTVDKRLPAGEQNRPRYSPRAVQETIVNAFAHRDYSDNNPVQVTAFDNRIEVVSPGGLVSNLTP